MNSKELLKKEHIKKKPWHISQASSSHGEFKHEVRQFEKSYDNQQAEQISLMV